MKRFPYGIEDVFFWKYLVSPRARARIGFLTPSQIPRDLYKRLNIFVRIRRANDGKNEQIGLPSFFFLSFFLTTPLLFSVRPVPGRGSPVPSNEHVGRRKLFTLHYAPPNETERRRRIALVVAIVFCTRNLGVFRVKRPSHETNTRFRGAVVERTRSITFLSACLDEILVVFHLITFLLLPRIHCWIK